MSEWTVANDTNRECHVRVRSVNCTNCSEALIEACRWARTVIADSMTFVVYIAEKLKQDHEVEYCKEARHVLMENLIRAIDGIDDAIDASNCRE